MEPNTQPDADKNEQSNQNQEGSGEIKEKEQQDHGADASDDSSWDPKTKAYIQSLRKESEKYRKRAKETETQFNQLNERFGQIQKGLKTVFGEEGEEMDPEVQAQTLFQHNQTLAFENAIQGMALENGLDGSSTKFLKFLISERAENMEEGEELDEEDLAELVQEARKHSLRPGKSSTSVDGGKTPPNPSGDNESGLTVEQFATMSITEKSTLYVKDKATYERLLREARQKKLIK